MRVLRGFVLSALGAPVAGFARPPCRISCEAIRWAAQHPRTTTTTSSSIHCHVRRRNLAAAATSTSSATAIVRRKRARPLGSALGDHEAPAAATPRASALGSTTTTTTSTTAAGTGDTPASWAPPAEATSSVIHDINDDVVAAAASLLPAAPPLPLLPLALLNAVTVLWGTQHAVIKLVLQGNLSPGVTNFARFGIAALMFSPWTPGLMRDPPPLPFSPPVVVPEDAADGGQDGGGGKDGGGSAAETWRAGAELGLWMFLGFAFQSIGLGFTTASRSAFLLYLNVKLVPFFAFVLEGRIISSKTWVSAFLAFFGTILLSADGSPPNVGDLWSVLAAATSAMFILRLEKYSGSCDASRLNSANLWVTAGLCGLWAAWEITSQGVDAGAALEGIRAQGALIGYLAVVTTALTNWMQALGQRSIPAERAAVIYAMDPVYAAGFAYLLLGESLGPTGIAGAGIITGAALWSQGQQAPAGEETE